MTVRQVAQGWFLLASLALFPGTVLALGSAPAGDIVLRVYSDYV